MKNFLENIEFSDYVKDNKMNASSVLMNTNALIEDELVAATVYAILYSKEKIELADKFLLAAGDLLDESLINGAKAASNVMAMNNVFYRGKHTLGSDYEKIAANLRMNIYTKHGIDKKYFEFISLAVSFINNCEYCIKSHAKLLEKEGMSKEQIHEALRIAAIFNTIREKY